jgi:hypothetical protein
MPKEQQSSEIAQPSHDQANTQGQCGEAATQKATRPQATMVGHLNHGSASGFGIDAITLHACVHDVAT